MKTFIHMALFYIAFGTVGEVWATPPATPDILNIECSPRDDNCWVFTERGEWQVPREALPWLVEWAPNPTPETCYQEFCYRTDQLTDKVGLNPQYPFN